MTTFLPLEEIKRQVFDIAACLGADICIDGDIVYFKPSREVCWEIFHFQPNFPPSSDGLSVIVKDDVYHYVITERGVTYEDRITTDIQKLLYWLSVEMTNYIASSFALKNPYPHWEQRRIRWKKQLELLASISPEFKKKFKEEITEILTRAPFEDGLPNNMDYEEWDTERSV